MGRICAQLGAVSQKKNVAATSAAIWPRYRPYCRMLVAQAPQRHDCTLMRSFNAPAVAAVQAWGSRRLLALAAAAASR